MSSRGASVRERLAAGSKRGLGCADEIARGAIAGRPLLPELVAALDDPRPLVISRAANALKKVQAEDPRALDPFARKLVRKALDCEVLEARWNLTVVVGGLRLKGRDRALAIELLFESMTSSSVFLRVSALQALVDFGEDDPELRRRVHPVLEDFLAHGTAAMQARARKLLPLLERR